MRRRELCPACHALSLLDVNFQSINVHMSAMKRGKERKEWHPIVFDEIFTATIMLPLAVADVRQPVACHLSATDGTLQCAGACVADVPRPVAGLLYRRSEKEANEADLT